MKRRRDHFESVSRDCGGFRRGRVMSAGRCTLRIVTSAYIQRGARQALSQSYCASGNGHWSGATITRERYPIPCVGPPRVMTEDQKDLRRTVQVQLQARWPVAALSRVCIETRCTRVRRWTKMIYAESRTRSTNFLKPAFSDTDSGQGRRDQAAIQVES